jgi:hypothetical protein
MKLSLKFNNILLSLLLLFFTAIIFYNFSIPSKEGFREGLDTEKDSSSGNTVSSGGNVVSVSLDNIHNIQSDMVNLQTEFTALLSYGGNTSGNSVTMPISKLNSFSSKLSGIQYSINNLAVNNN